MKKIMLYLAGVVTGVVVVFLMGLIVASSSSNKGKTLFEKEGDCISEEPFRVIEVSESGDALAYKLEDGYLPSDLLVLFLKEDGKSYYDSQVIEPPIGKCVKQIGVFRYTTKSNMEKTIPIVAIR